MNLCPVLFTIASVFVLAGNAGAQETPDAASAAAPPLGLLDRVAQAKKALAASPLQPSAVGSDDAVLAVWDGTDQGEVAIVALRRGKSRAPAYAFVRERLNGLNTTYVVTQPAGGVVLAVKAKVCGRQGCRRPATVVYAPYSPGLHTPETVAAGRAYLDQVLAGAAADLDRRGTFSRALDGEPVSAAVSPRILAALLIVEHAASDRIAAVGIQRVVEQVLVTLALNGEDAYDRAVSRARAQGLAQFIRRSYRETRLRYPKAGIAADYDAGTADHLNAVKAAYCLADWSLTELRPETLDDLRLPGFEEDLGAFVAAAYNGGEERAARALYRRPGEWEKPHRGLYRETVGYVRVFREVYRFLNRSEAAPSATDATFDP